MLGDFRVTLQIRTQGSVLPRGWGQGLCDAQAAGTSAVLAAANIAEHSGCLPQNPSLHILDTVSSFTNLSLLEIFANGGPYGLALLPSPVDV